MFVCLFLYRSPQQNYFFKKITKRAKKFERTFLFNQKGTMAGRRTNGDRSGSPAVVSGGSQSCLMLRVVFVNGRVVVATVPHECGWRVHKETFALPCTSHVTVHVCVIGTGVGTLHVPQTTSRTSAPPLILLSLVSM